MSHRSPRSFTDVESGSEYLPSPASVFHQMAHLSHQPSKSITPLVKSNLVLLSENDNVVHLSEDDEVISSLHLKLVPHMMSDLNAKQLRHALLAQKAPGVMLRSDLQAL